MPWIKATLRGQVVIARASADGSENVVVGGDFCSPLAPGVNALADGLLTKPDPIEFLASKREAVRQRLDHLGQSPPTP